MSNLLSFIIFLFNFFYSTSENESKESKKVNENVENKIQNQKIKSTETIVKNTDVKQHKQTNKSIF